MGNSRSIQLLEVSKPLDPKIWTKYLTLPHCEVLRNIHTGQQAELYAINFEGNMLQQFEKYEYRRIQTQNLVSVLNVEKIDSQYLCAGQQKLKVITERIPYLLADVENLSINQAFYILYEALIGFKKIFQSQGYVAITDELVGFSQKGEVKVWMNSNFAVNSTEIVIKKSNQRDWVLRERMIQQLFLVVEEHTTNKKYPDRFRQLIADQYIKDFLEGINLIRDYSIQQNIVFPNKIIINPNGNLKKTDVIDQFAYSGQGQHFKMIQQNPKPIILSKQPSRSIKQTSNPYRQINNQNKFNRNQLIYVNQPAFQSKQIKTAKFFEDQSKTVKSYSNASIHNYSSHAFNNNQIIQTQQPVSTMRPNNTRYNPYQQNSYNNAIIDVRTQPNIRSETNLIKPQPKLIQNFNQVEPYRIQSNTNLQPNPNKYQQIRNQIFGGRVENLENREKKENQQKKIKQIENLNSNIGVRKKPSIMDEMESQKNSQFSQQSKNEQNIPYKPNNITQNRPQMFFGQQRQRINNSPQPQALYFNQSKFHPPNIVNKIKAKAAENVAEINLQQKVKEILAFESSKRLKEQSIKGDKSMLNSNPSQVVLNKDQFTKPNLQHIISYENIRVKQLQNPRNR